MQVRVAVEALRAELSREGVGDAAVASSVEIATRLSEAAMSGALSPAQVEELEALVTELERVVRRRRYAETD